MAKKANPSSSKKSQPASAGQGADAGSKKGAPEAAGAAKGKEAATDSEPKAKPNPKAKAEVASGATAQSSAPASAKSSNKSNAPSAAKPAASTSSGSGKSAAGGAAKSTSSTPEKVSTGTGNNSEAATDNKTPGASSAKVSAAKDAKDGSLVDAKTAANQSQPLTGGASTASGSADSASPVQGAAPAAAQTSAAGATSPEPVSAGSGAAGKAAPTAAGKPRLGPSNIVIGLAMTVMGVSLVAVVYFFTPTPTRDQDVPYLLEPLEKHLDKTIRYKPPHTTENKDWRKDFADEQFIWRNELSKMMLGAQDAKPIEFKRDFLLYLGDSFFRDEPNFAEAKAAYLTAAETNRIPHEKVYDFGDDELWRRIAYCDIRLGFYDEADKWLKKAMLFNQEASAKEKPDVLRSNTRNRILDNLAENYARMGQTKAAEEQIGIRLKEMGQADPDSCIEIPVVFNLALTKQIEGDYKKSEHFYKQAIKVCSEEDVKRGVVPESPNDNNRALARVLMEYSHLLRLMHRNDEAIAAMRRALVIYDNAPQ